MTAKWGRGRLCAPRPQGSESFRPHVQKLRRLRTLGTEAVKGELVAFYDEAIAELGAVRYRDRAGIEVENLLAGTALEVMVMAKPAHLVPRFPARQDHRLDLAGLLQQVQRPVHGGDTQAGHVLLGAVEDLLYCQRSLGIADDLEDLIALSGVPLTQRHAFLVAFAHVPAGTFRDFGWCKSTKGKVGSVDSQALNSTLSIPSGRLAGAE